MLVENRGYAKVKEGGFPLGVKIVVPFEELNV